MGVNEEVTNPSTQSRPPTLFSRATYPYLYFGPGQSLNDDRHAMPSSNMVVSSWAAPVKLVVSTVVCDRNERRFPRSLGAYGKSSGSIFIRKGIYSKYVVVQNVPDLSWGFESDF